CSSHARVHQEPRTGAIHGPCISQACPGQVRRQQGQRSYVAFDGDCGMKRFLDVICAALALALLSPVMLVVAWLIRRQMGSPVLFRQMRPGLGGKPFLMVKFRTMRDARNAQGVELPDSERLTRLGQFLRATSLDELPELWNVLKGDMSLVGPRPLLMEYLPLYSLREFRRHEVRPGVTGWAQVNGRNSLSWQQKFEMDVWYVD